MSEKKSIKVMIDARGTEVPVGYVSAADKRRDRIVRRLHKKAVKISGLLSEFRGEALSAIEDYDEWIAQHEKVATRKNVKGNRKLTSFDGSIRIERKMQDKIDFDDRLQMAQELISDHIKSLTDGAGHDLQVIVDNHFNASGAGRLSAARVLGLLKYDIKAAKWLQAMELIRKSILVTSTRTYVHVYERKGDDVVHTMVSLDIASA